MDKKIGFCCKFKAPLDLDAKAAKELEAQFNSKSTTVLALSKLSKKEMFKKLEPIVNYNLSSTLKLLEYTKTLPSELHMLRISSDILPLKTHELTKDFWQIPSIKKLIEDKLKIVGQYAKDNNIRVGFHPGQFCVLNSNDDRVLGNSIKEFEYHIDMAKMMGYTKWHEDGFFCNVHVGGRNNGTKQLIKNLKKLSKEARNLITIENDEYSFGVDECLELQEHVALVLDIHHHWCKTGEYIQPTDPRIDVILQSWRGVRPIMHYSISQAGLFPCSTDKLPNLQELKDSGLKIKDLRAHSDWYWNEAVNKYAYSFLEKFDIELECKFKNQASLLFLNQFK